MVRGRGKSTLLSASVASSVNKAVADQTESELVTIINADKSGLLGPGLLTIAKHCQGRPGDLAKVVSWVQAGICVATTPEPQETAGEQSPAGDLTTPWTLRKDTQGAPGAPWDSIKWAIPGQIPRKPGKFIKPGKPELTFSLAKHA